MGHYQERPGLLRSGRTYRMLEAAFKATSDPSYRSKEIYVIGHNAPHVGVLREEFVRHFGARLNSVLQRAHDVDIDDSIGFISAAQASAMRFDWARMQFMRPPGLRTGFIDTVDTDRVAFVDHATIESWCDPLFAELHRYDPVKKEG